MAHRRVTLSGPKNNVATYTDVVARERVSLIFNTLERAVNSDIQRRGCARDSASGIEQMF